VGTRVSCDGGAFTDHDLRRLETLGVEADPDEQILNEVLELLRGELDQIRALVDLPDDVFGVDDARVG
jgi:hypothetical protein